jgi:cyanophycinase
VSSVQARAGTVVAIGGALKGDSDVVWQRIVDEAGGPGAAIAVFPTAAYEPERSGAQIAASLRRCGAAAEIIPVAPHLEGGGMEARLHDPALIARVAACRGVFFSGGAQELIVDTLQPGGEATAMLGAVRAVFEAGGVVAGTSAGAAVMSQMMFRDAMDSLAVLKGQWRAGREYDRGLGLLGPGLLVDQHFLKRGRIGRMLPALQSLGCRLGLGVDENAAVVVKGTLLDVIGGSGAVLVDVGDATCDVSLPAFNLRGARLRYLAQGDRHDLATGVTTPAADKRLLPRPPAAPLGAAQRYFLDFLGDGCLLAAMRQLLDDAAPDVRGLAHRVHAAAGDASPDIGFEFHLYRGPAFAGWSAPELGDGGTVLDVRLDVNPVRVARPLFVPLAAVATQ